MMGRMRRAAHDRLAAVRGQGNGADAGFALIYVLTITMLITIGVASVLVVTASNVLPAAQGQDDVTALAAAEAGLQDYVAALNTNCTTFDGTACSYIASHGTATGVPVHGTDGKGAETYDLRVKNPSTYLSDGFLRVQSTGHAGRGSKTLVADLSGLPGVLRFAYLSKYETLAKSFVDSYYPARTVAIPSSAAQAAANKASSPTSVTWGAPSGTDVCDKLYYDDSTNPTDTAEANSLGADADPAYQHPGRRTVKTYRSNIPLGYDWSATTGTGVQDYQPCEVTFTTGMTFTGPVYSRDAVYFSYGAPGGSGPKFVVPAKETLPAVSTGWGVNSIPQGDASQLYRLFPIIQGGPSTDSTGYPNTVQTSKYDLELPSTVSDAAGRALCIYQGPTRIVVNGANATVISPLTPTSAGACYTNTGTGFTSSITPNGVTSAVVPINSTTIYVKDLGTGVNSARASAGSLFSLSTPASDTGWVNGTPTVTAADNGYVPNTVTYLLANPPISDGGWTLRWPTYSLLSVFNILNPTCAGLIGSLTASPDLAFFNCNVPHPGYNDAYSYVKHAVQVAVAANPSAYTTPTALAALVKSIVAVTASGTLIGNTSDWNNAGPDYATNQSHRYVVSAVNDPTTTDGCTPGTSTTQGSPTPVARPSNDKFLSTASQGYVTPSTQQTTTCMTATVNLQVGTKNATGADNGCKNNPTHCGWGDGTTFHVGDQYTLAQFKVTAKVVAPATGAHTTSTTVAFPDAQDATRYASYDGSKTNAPGDLYVEGTGITKQLSLVADHDVIVTGPLTTTHTSAPDPGTGENSWTSGGAVDLVAANNVRLYHPVSCASTSGTTTAGYCANDITGLYTGVLTNSDGTFQVTHPAMQYCNLTTGSAANTGNTNCSVSPPTATGTGAVSEIDASVFALNGSLMTDNYNRGLPMDSATIVGGIYQLHRGATGQQWEMPTTGSARAYSGYRLQDTYLAMQGAGLPYVPALQTGNRKTAWNIVSISAGS